MDGSEKFGHSVIRTLAQILGTQASMNEDVGAALSTVGHAHPPCPHPPNFQPCSA